MSSSVRDVPGYDGYNFFKDSQYYALWFMGTLSCILSLVGSGTILYLIWKRHKMDELYHRLILGLSVSDVLTTVGLTIQPYMLPRESGYPFAIGNQTTCTIVGILHPFYISSYCHNCALALYFMLMIRYGKKEKDIQRLLEPWCYIFAFGFPLIYTTVCASLGLFNPNPFMGLCNVFPYPADCTFIEDVECTRGKEAAFMVPIHDATTLVLVVVGLVCTWMVFSTIQQRGRVMRRYSFAGQLDENQYARQQDVSVQAIYYAFAYSIGFVTVVLTEILKGIYKPQLEVIGDMANFPFFVAMTFLIWLFFPLQGLLNCIIYIRPRLKQWQRFDTRRPRWWALRMVLSGQSPPNRRISSSVFAMNIQAFVSPSNDSSSRDLIGSPRSKHSSDAAVEETSKEPDAMDATSAEVEIVG
eukprot:Nitzschia sp. Nitz4//scaffold146_size56529//53231//54469//NITZ4_006582-RA/size56529-processed-gene-0.57-mRNA-1//1//CDS//3329536653//4143//frame0